MQCSFDAQQRTFAFKSSRLLYNNNLSRCKISVKELIEMLHKFCYFFGILQLLLPTESEKCTASCIGFHIHTECFGYIMYIKMADW